MRGSVFAAVVGLVVSSGTGALGAGPSATGPSPSTPSSDATSRPVGAESTEQKSSNEEPAAVVVAADDQLTNHFTVAANAGLAIPVGSLDNQIGLRKAVGEGATLSVELDYGLSRSVAAGLWGQGVLLGSGSDCTDCSSTSYAFGLMARYHLAQGVRFDQWIGAGLGWRRTLLETGGVQADYSGPEWVRLTVGGDWLPHPSFSIGPMLELDAGVYSNRPSPRPALLDTAASGKPGSAWHWLLSAGIRVMWDIPGRRSRL